MNLCCNCQHRHSVIDDPISTLGNVCRAPAVGFEPAINPVTGLPCWRGEMDGQMFYCESAHPQCIWINPMGECAYFEAKQPNWFTKAMMN